MFLDCLRPVTDLPHCHRQAQPCSIASPRPLPASLLSHLLTVLHVPSQAPGLFLALSITSTVSDSSPCGEKEVSFPVMTSAGCCGLLPRRAVPEPGLWSWKWEEWLSVTKPQELSTPCRPWAVAVLSILVSPGFESQQKEERLGSE